MPLIQCTLNGRPGWKWGEGGKCYTGSRAKKKAILQGVAIGGGGLRHDAVKPENTFVTYLKALGMTESRIRSRLRRRGTVRPIPRTVERKYEIQLKRLVASWRTLYLQTIDPHLEGLAQEAYALKPPGSIGVRTDAWPEKLDQIAKQYEAQVTATLAPMERIAIDAGNDISNLNLKQWKQVVSRVVGINIYASEPWLSDQISSFAKQNVQLINKLAQDTRANVERIVEDGFQRGRRIENIRKDIVGGTRGLPGQVISYKTKTGKPVSWFQTAGQRATLVARDQTNKLNSQLSQLRQNEIGIDRYIWHTVADERVRLSHQAMNGLLCRWDNAMVYSADGGKTWVSRSGVGGIEQHPGQDYQCRCFPEADFSAVLDDPGPVTKPTKVKKK